MGGKRKDGPGGGNRGGQAKKNKGSHQGRWQTPHQKSKMAHLTATGNKVEAGDVGIWVTCQRKLEKKAIAEMIALCDEQCEKLYGIAPPTEEEIEAYFRPAGAEGKASVKETDQGKEEEEEEEEEEDGDIEAAIKKELEAMKPMPMAQRAKKKPLRAAFLPVNLNCESVFFIRTHAPVQPVQLALAICEDARRCAAPRERKAKYINRLTPVVGTAKATETAVGVLARDVLGQVFKLRPVEEGEQAEGEKDEDKEEEEERQAFTYAIRTAKRNHNTLSTDTVIKKVAGQVSLPHTVNLTKPDKMVLIDIFRNIAGMSVVDGADFERLKKFNLDSIYKAALEEVAAAATAEKQKVQSGVSTAASTTAAAAAATTAAADGPVDTKDQAGISAATQAAGGEQTGEATEESKEGADEGAATSAA
ncbi:hypothetical protein TD95_005426 [Thielaviopsis punctulata]|uniref:THUMP domain-containing protein n=1 Tax=Thielaviopsis punctulata TaxID=72032 RepID=A0A0F4Z901_9PEZI|nr:hypothetical protein TD95_005426 [Thielaviopsis punctulata]